MAAQRARGWAAALLTAAALAGTATPAQASTSVITTFAGSGVAGLSGDGGPAVDADLSAPAGVAVDAAGDVYVADEAADVVRKITPDGTIRTVAGTGVAGYTGDGGPATTAQLTSPTDVVVDATGSLYIADSGNHVVRKVNTSGVISTAAGTGNPGYNGDTGQGRNAKLDTPAGLGMDTFGNLYIADYGNDTVRRLDSSGRITTIAGTGVSGFSGDGGQATSAQLDQPSDVVSVGGRLYIADGGNARVREVTRFGQIITIAGTGIVGSSGDGGPATAATLTWPAGVAADSSGDLFVADYGANKIREISSAGTITTVAGTGTAGFSGDGGDPLAASFRSPARVDLDSSGDLFVSDWNNHRVRKISALGAAAVAPDAPTAVTATAGDAQAAVSWTAPASDGGSPITGYTVTGTDGTTSVGPITTDAATTDVLVTGLTNGTAYTFTVTATNTAGTSPASAPSAAVTPSPAITAPDAPTAVAATAGDAQATVSWTAPAADGGSPITGYTVTGTDGTTTTAPVQVDGVTTEATLFGLTNGTAYTFTVTATNAAGDSPASAPSAPVTPMAPPPAATAPDAPTGVTATGGDAQATVSWTAPASDGGSPITGYTVTGTDGTATTTPVQVDGTTTTLTVTGLTNGTAYTFTVTATNTAGTSAASSPSASVTPAAPPPPPPAATAPDAPTGVTATGGDAQAAVDWTAPASDGGSPITGYAVTAHHGGTDDTPIPVDATTTTLTVTGLTNGTAYTFTVTATNTAGDSPASAPSAPVTPVAPPPAATAPDAPTGVTATGGDGQATVDWTAPASDGGSPITGYAVTAHHGGTDDTPIPVDATTTTLTVTGLTNGTAYTFTVTATNTAGTSTASSPSASVTPVAPPPPPPPVSAPDAPTGVTATAGDGQATVDWTAPASDGGSPITGYTVTAHHGGTDDTPIPVDATTTTLTVTGLTNGTAYTFTVTATNTAGTSTASSPSASVTPVAPPPPPPASPPVDPSPTAPGAPQHVTATAGDGQATVSWNPPGSDGGSPITGYTVTAHHGGTDDTPIPVDATTTTLTVTGLTNGTAYTFTVTATNTAGTSAASSPSASVTPVAPPPPPPASPPVDPSPTAPGAPQHVTATAGDGQATVSWNPPGSDGGSPITGYTVTAHHDGVDDPGVAVDAATTTLTLPLLTNGTSYTFTVTATNTAGTSVDSDPSAPVTPVAPPPPPPTSPPPTGGGGGQHHGGSTGSTGSTQVPNPGPPTTAPVPPATHTGPDGTGSTPTAGAPSPGTPTTVDGPARPVGPVVTPPTTTATVGHRHHPHHAPAHRSGPGQPVHQPHPAAQPHQDPPFRAPHAVGTWSSLGHVVATVSKNTAIPVALLILAGLFLLVQNRLDRRDPKLALAPVYGDPGVAFVPALS